MTLLEIAAILLTLAAAFAFINARWVRLPPTIGLMVLALIFSLALVGVAHPFPAVGKAAQRLLDQISFDRTVLDGVLGYILFAGALHVSLENLRQDKLVVGVMATVGVLASTLLVGGAIWGVMRLLSLDVPILYCMLLGVCVSPTDPIAVLAILKSLGVSRDLKTKIGGESLFNDGMSIVVFIALLGMTGLGGQPTVVEPQASHGAQAATSSVENIASDASASAPADHPVPSGRQLGQIGLLFLREVGGGIVLGLVLGYLTYRLLKPLDSYQTEVLITLAAATGGYVLALRLGLSAPIAVALIGLLVGNPARLAASEISERNVDMFWELIDEILNAVLFVLVGMGVLVVQFTTSYLIAGLLTIPLVLLARFVAVGSAVGLLRLRASFTPHTVKVMTWGGLHGAVSIALALALRQYVYHHDASDAVRGAADLILTATYIVVLFSIIVQGLTMNPLVKYLGLTHRESQREVSEPE